MKTWWLALALFLLSAQAVAHKSSDAYLRLEPRGQELVGRLDVALRDLALLAPLGDGADVVRWGDVRSASPALLRELASSLQLESTANTPCSAHPTLDGVVNHSDGPYAVFALRFDCGNASPLRLRYHLLAQQDPDHRAIVQLATARGAEHHVLGPAEPELMLAASGDGLFAQLWTSIGRGFQHILEGTDHLAFLLVLVLPLLVLRRATRGWSERAATLAGMLPVITSFTVAHSLTLGLATFGLVTLPSRLVECAIALSVVLAAVDNVRPMLRAERWVLAFGLGLVHGFGFSSALTDLGLPRLALFTALAGFNFGVELGQLLVLCALAPLLLWLAEQPRFGAPTLRYGSLFAAAFGAIWLAERAFDVNVLAR